MNAYIRKEERGKINNLSFHFSILGKQKQIEPKLTEEKKIRIRAEINEIENRKSIKKITETKSWFLEKINESDKPLARLIKKKRERIQMTNIWNKRRDHRSDSH